MSDRGLILIGASIGTVLFPLVMELASWLHGAPL